MVIGEIYTLCIIKFLVTMASLSTNRHVRASAKS